jgi:PQQ-dependent catabolism-associated CXXCW motif protein
MRTTLAIFGLAACLAAGALPALAQEPPADQAAALFDAQGYRIARYRSPIRADPDPAPRLALSAALELVPGRDALFLDVMPVESGVRDPVTGAWTISQPHRTIPGAEWHPEAGRMPADADLWQALERAARKGGPRRPVIIFCRTDCWMSWNAARRLAASGLDNVWWLAEGTDGWHSAGRDLVVASPVTIPASR